MNGKFKTCNYSPTGPAHWANMDGNAACGLKKQSPIDIVTKDVKYKDDLNEFVMSGYDEVQGTLFLHNNGHSGKPTHNRESQSMVLFTKIFGLLTCYNCNRIGFCAI